jgi:hypothetical protein
MTMGAGKEANQITSPVFFLNQNLKKKGLYQILVTNLQLFLKNALLSRML